MRVFPASTPGCVETIRIRELYSLEEPVAVHKPPMNELLNQSATGLADMIRTRRITAYEAVSTHIDHIRHVNAAINAVVCERFEAAMAEARAMDRRLGRRKTPDKRPLIGVPFTVKESFCVQGMPNTSGLVSRKGALCDTDATVVARLKKAGAIVMGVTNVSELCMWVESNNRVYGRSNNPYNPYRIVGGSSGGEGAAVGAGGSPFGLASDIAGSIRLPAFFNGVFGHKPTGGLVPATGHFPVPTDKARLYATMGPICRRAEDLMPLLAILAGPDGIDHRCRRIPLADPEAVSPSDLSVLDVRGNGRFALQSDLVEAQRRCVDALADAGAAVLRKKFETLKHAFHIWTAMMHDAEEKTFASLMADGRRTSPYGHLMRWCLRQTPHTLPAIGLAVYERLVRPGDKYLEMGRALKAELAEAIGPNGVMIYPSFTSTAPLHYLPMLRPQDWTLAGIFNVMEFPATQVPLGYDKHGMPLGVQVVAIPGNDHLTIAAAGFLEREFGGWSPPAKDVSDFSPNPASLALEYVREGSRWGQQHIPVISRALSRLGRQ